MITVKDVAKKAGVSVSTVSCVLRDAPNVSDRVKKQVRKIMDDLGYVPNSLARGMVGSRTHKIAYFFPGYQNFPWSNNAHIIEGVGQTLLAAEYSLNFVPLQGANDPIEAIRRFYAGARPDAALFHDVYFTSGQVEALSEMPVPYLFVNNQIKSATASYVANDEQGGAELAVRHLLELGHRRIAILGPTHEAYFGRPRHAGYRKALQAAGVKDDPELHWKVSWFQSGQEEIRPRIQSVAKHGVTALFCLSDLLAAEVLVAARALKLNVPRDLSIVGYDDELFVRYLSPQLTTVASPGLALGRKAGELILDWIRQQPRGAQHVVLPAELVVRESTRPAKG